MGELEKLIVELNLVLNWDNRKKYEEKYTIIVIAWDFKSFWI